MNNNENDDDGDVIVTASSCGNSSCSTSSSSPPSMPLAVVVSKQHEESLYPDDGGGENDNKQQHAAGRDERVDEGRRRCRRRRSREESWFLSARSRVGVTSSFSSTDVSTRRRMLLSTSSWSCLLAIFVLDVAVGVGGCSWQRRRARRHGMMTTTTPGMILLLLWMMIVVAAAVSSSGTAEREGVLRFSSSSSADPQQTITTLHGAASHNKQYDTTSRGSRSRIGMTIPTTGKEEVIPVPAAAVPDGSNRQQESQQQPPPQRHRQQPRQRLMPRVAEMADSQEIVMVTTSSSSSHSHSIKYMLRPRPTSKITSAAVTSANMDPAGSTSSEKRVLKSLPIGGIAPTTRQLEQQEQQFPGLIRRLDQVAGDPVVNEEGEDVEEASANDPELTNNSNDALPRVVLSPFDVSLSPTPFPLDAADYDDIQIIMENVIFDHVVEDRRHDLPDNTTLDFVLLGAVTGTHDADNSVIEMEVKSGAAWFDGDGETVPSNHDVDVWVQEAIEQDLLDALKKYPKYSYLAETSYVEVDGSSQTSDDEDGVDGGGDAPPSEEGTDVDGIVREDALIDDGDGMSITKFGMTLAIVAGSVVASMLCAMLILRRRKNHSSQQDHRSSSAAGGALVTSCSIDANSNNSNFNNSGTHRNFRPGKNKKNHNNYNHDDRTMGSGGMDDDDDDDEYSKNSSSSSGPLHKQYDGATEQRQFEQLQSMPPTSDQQQKSPTRGRGNNAGAGSGSKRGSRSSKTPDIITFGMDEPVADTSTATLGSHKDSTDGDNVEMAATDSDGDVSKIFSSLSDGDVDCNRSVASSNAGGTGGGGASVSTGVSSAGYHNRRGTPGGSSHHSSNGGNDDCTKSIADSESEWTVNTEAGDSLALKSLPNSRSQLQMLLQQNPPAVMTESFERDRQVSLRKDMLTSPWSGRVNASCRTVPNDTVLQPSHFSASQERLVRQSHQQQQQQFHNPFHHQQQRDDFEVPSSSSGIMDYFASGHRYPSTNNNARVAGGSYANGTASSPPPTSANPATIAAPPTLAETAAAIVASSSTSSSSSSSSSSKSKEVRQPTTTSSSSSPPFVAVVTQDDDDDYNNVVQQHSSNSLLFQQAHETTIEGIGEEVHLVPPTPNSRLSTAQRHSKQNVLF